MQKLEMFLGFPLTEAFAAATSKLDPQLLQLYINQNNEYLTQVIYQGVVYWGKNIEKMCDVDTLELLQNNIYSVLKKVLPEYPYDKTSLVLFPLVLETA